MKINPVANSNMINAYKASKPFPAGKGYEAAADQVNLSRETIEISSTIAKIKQKVELRSPEELERIRQIAAQVRDGSYHVDSSKVADKIIEEMTRT